jgi:hypothetical protein
MSRLTLETVQWSSLPDIDGVQPIGEADVQVLDEIREVLLQHDRSDRFGVCLLHKHFEIASNEIAVEYTDIESRTSTVVEPSGSSAGGNHIETVWRFKHDGPAAVTVCEQRCHYDKGHRSVHVKAVGDVQNTSLTIWIGVTPLLRAVSY